MKTTTCDFPLGEQFESGGTDMATCQRHAGHAGYHSRTRDEDEAPAPAIAMTRRERKERRLARRLDWAASRDAKAESAFGSARHIADQIPLGQPILVGHHSEGRARRDQARIEGGMAKGFESVTMADHHRSVADGIQHQLDSSIFSDDPDAVEALAARIAGLETERDRMKRINAEIKRGAGWQERLSTAELLLTAREQQQLLDVLRFQPYLCDKKTGLPVFPGYALSNLGANIRRLKGRLTEIKARRPEKE